MPDYGSRVADKAIKETEREIRSVYRQAAKELKGKLAEFQQKHAAKEKLMREKRDLGLITEQEYKDWMTGQLFMEKQWKDKVDQASRIMNNANAEAAKIVQEKKLNVFAENYNYQAYELSKKVGTASGFNVYNSESVARLTKEKPDVLPKWKIDEKKDYKWNYKKVNNTVKQGIIQGESIDEITDRLVKNLCTQNEDKMRTFARTAVTGAQNAGRMEQMHDAEDLGIKLKKQWVATLDSRTREAHQDLDGQAVPVDEPFTVEVDGDILEIMFPGDPDADPCLVYNCRCSMIQVYEGIDRKSIRRDENDNAVEDMTYKEWKKAKEEGTLQTEKKLVEKPIGKETKKQEEKAEGQGEPPKDYKEATEKIDTVEKQIYDLEKRIENEEKGSDDYTRLVEEHTALRGELETLQGQRMQFEYPDDAVMGEFKKTGQTTYLETAKATNPDYGKDAQHKVNCSCCVVANEARARGYDVVAGVADKKMKWYWWDANGNVEKGKGSWTDCFEGIKIDRVKAIRKTQVKEKIENIVKGYGSGSRAVVYVAWDRGGGHYFTVQNVFGDVKFTNPQNPGADIDEFFKYCSPSKTDVLRVDNLRFTDYVKKAVVKNEGTD